jgi:hypothetical protein
MGGNTMPRFDLAGSIEASIQRRFGSNAAVGLRFLPGWVRDFYSSRSSRFIRHRLNKPQGGAQFACGKYLYPWTSASVLK